MPHTRHPVLDRYESWRAYADAHRLNILDQEWLGIDHYYAVVCQKGHVKRKQLHYWTRAHIPCKVCWNEECMAPLQAAAQAIDAVCLDEQWLGASSKYRFRCANGHTWERAWIHKTLGHCDECAKDGKGEGPRRVRHVGLGALQQAAAHKGGVCEGDAYLGTWARYGFRCEQGHRWYAKGINVLRGTWCRACIGAARRLPDGLERIQKAAANKGGICLSTDYTSMTARYLFRCAHAHEWEAKGGAIVRGSWCLQCARGKR